MLGGAHGPVRGPALVVCLLAILLMAGQAHAKAVEKTGDLLEYDDPFVYSIEPLMSGVIKAQLKESTTHIARRTIVVCGELEDLRERLRQYADYFLGDDGPLRVVAWSDLDAMPEDATLAYFGRSHGFAEPCLEAEGAFGEFVRKNFRDPPPNGTCYYAKRVTAEQRIRYFASYYTDEPRSCVYIQFGVLLGLPGKLDKMPGDEDRRYIRLIREYMRELYR